MDGFLALIWFVGTIAAIVFIFKPNRDISFVSNRKRAAGVAAAVFFGVPIFAAVLGTGRSANQTATPSASTQASSATQAAAEPTKASSPEGSATTQSAEPSKWTYSSSTDQMRGTSSSIASVESNESFPNSFGMGGETTSLVVLHRASGNEIELNNSNLQFTCSSFTSTHVSVKFDNGPIERFACTDAKGSKFGVAFILSETKFLSKLRRAKKVVVEAEIFQRGDTQMSFDVAGLKS